MAKFRQVYASFSKQTLIDRYHVAIEENGTRVSVQISGREQGEFETDWASSGNTEELLKFLESYRMSPDAAKPDPSVRAMLRNFLFCQGILDGPVSSLMKPGGELYLTGDEASLPLLLNIPWELTDGVPSLTQDKGLMNTLAALPVTRIVRGLTSATRFTQERLQVGYCISEPLGVSSIGAANFQKWFNLVLRDRTGMLDYSPVLGTNFDPRLAQLETQVTERPVHIFIVVSHGRTTKGVPELRFDDWTPVEKVAKVLAATQKTFLVLVIACDQVFLEDGSSAHSGAHSFLKAGIPAVVAMQSRVRADLAATFLGTLLDKLLGGLALAAAVAEGRKSMAPAGSKLVEEVVDWSFPALFQTQNGADQIRDLREYFQFRPALEALLRSIPIVERYFARNSLEAAVTEFLRPKSVGLKEVIGTAVSGRSELIRECSRRSILTAIEMGDTTFRPILYVDLNRYGGKPIDSAADLIAILSKRVEEVKPTLSGSSLINLRLPRARGAEGSGLVADPIRQLIELIDQGKLVLVLDNVEGAGGAAWVEFVSASNTLLYSVVILGAETQLGQPRLGAECRVDVSPLTREETRAFLEQFGPEFVGKADELFTETAGMPCLLEAHMHGLVAGEEVFQMTMLRLPTSDQAVIYKLALLPNGVSPALAWDFFPEWREADVPGLALQGMLLSESRYGLGQMWFQVPGMLGRSLRTSYENALNEAAEQLMTRFAEKIGEENAEQELQELAERPGGLQFIQDIQSVMIGLGTEEYFGLARAISILLHEHLYRRAKWWDDYQLTKRVLAAMPFEDTEASDWFRLAKAQHLLGLGGEARVSLEKAEEIKTSALEDVEMIDLRINLLKDSGDRQRLAEMMQMYEQAFALVDNYVGEDAEAMARKRGTLLYNRGILRQHWGRDLAGALRDLEDARAAYHSFADANMEAMATMEWVDVQLSSRMPGLDWTALFGALTRASELLEALQAVGDLALCHYRFARLYRRKPYADAEESRNNLVKAREAYEESERLAAIAGDSRQAAIAGGHIVEVAWRDLGAMEAAEATSRLSKAISTLRSFNGDAWSGRVLRDMMALLAELQMHDGSPQARLTTLRSAWGHAKNPPLNPASGTDASRAARIFALYLDQLVALGERFAPDLTAGQAKDLIDGWLNQNIDPTKRNWLAGVRAFGKEPGKYHG
jgi:tetratricopeptide (TPR) repeat protein